MDVKDKDGVTPLMSAADYAKDAAVRELLKLGAKHDAKKSDGVMAIHRAASSALSDGPPTDTCSKNAANAVRILVEASEGGADAGTLDAPSDAGTPFLCACALPMMCCAKLISPEQSTRQHAHLNTCSWKVFFFE